MIATIAMGAFALAAAASAIRVLLGPSLADRMAALDAALLSLMGAVVVDAAATGDTTNLVLLVVISIVGFTATVAASRFIEQGSRK